MVEPTPPESVHNPGTLISPQEARAKQLAGATLIDVRGPLTRASQGLIPDAVVIDKSRIAAQLAPGSDEIIATITGLDAEVVVFCGNEFGSDPVVDVLQSLGYTRVYQIAGGVGGWVEDGLPMIASGAVQPADREVTH